MFFKNLTKYIFRVKCLFYYFKVFGVATTKLDITLAKNSGTNCIRFSHSKRALYYNVIFILLLITSHMYSIPYFYQLTDRVKFEKVSDCLQEIVSSSAAFLILTKFCLSSDELISITNRIIRITESLLHFNTGEEYTSKLSLEIGIIFLVNIIIWIIVLTTAAIDDIMFIPYDIIVYSST